MIRQFELVEKVLAYNPQGNEALLNRAYVYAMKQHDQQKRANGDPYIQHPLEVASILTDYKVDDATVVAALLHDTIEDTGTTRDEISGLFGDEIAELVDGLTKIKKLDLVSKRAVQAENLRKLLLAVTSDVRVLLVKLADRLHNMRTIQFMPEHKRRRIAEETLDIYAPLAGRMGMHDLREELEDISFRAANPQAHAAIAKRLADARERLDAPIEAIEAALERLLSTAGIQARVKGREKKAYSIWRKQERKSISFEQLSDIFGFRVIVRSVEECYRTVGLVHTAWPCVPGRFKDYVSTPKSNDYRSIHTTVIGPGNQRVEMQIRTEDMHRVAEFGIAAHSLYKDGSLVVTERGHKVLHEGVRPWQWLSQTVKALSDSAPEEFIEHTKLELFQDQVFCFTPKGRLIALPRGATPIDFAYAVHTELGNTCVACKVNGRLAPLADSLMNGDEVEIVSSKTSIPPVAWETIAVTGKARYEIRKATRAAVRTQYAGLGRSVLRRAFEKAEKTYSDDRVEPVLRRLGRGQLEDVLAAVGRGEMPPEDVVRAVYPDWKAEPLPLAPARPTNGADRAAGTATAALSIRGSEPGQALRFAGGGAVPGDRIVGIRTDDGAIIVHQIASQALRQYEDEPDRWVDLRWDVEDEERRFPARIRLQSINEPGTLAQIAAVIAEHQGNIDNVRMDRRSPDFTEMTIDVGVFNVKHLNAIISQLGMKSVVSKAERLID